MDSFPLTGSLRSPPLPRTAGARNRGRELSAFPRPHEVGERWRAQRAGEGAAQAQTLDDLPVAPEEAP